jgi:uncharacterized membrane protein YdjX (TVP38/TMEM64 family)
MTPPSQPVSAKSQWLWRAILALLAVAVLLFALRWIKESGLLKRALDWIQELGPAAPVAFIAIYVGSALCLIPVSFLTLGAGFVFGFMSGSIYVLTAAMIAGNLMFLIARHLARDWIAHRLDAQPKFKALDDAVAREGWKIVALVRFAPVFPFSITCYAFGLTRLPLWEYFLANFTMIPATVMYVYFGAVARDLTEKVATPPWMKWAIGAVSVIVVLYVTRFARRALAQKVS